MENTTLWEEKNSTGPMKKLESNQIIGQNDIIKETKSKFANKECASIGKIKKSNRQEKVDYTAKKFGRLTILKQYIGFNNKTYVECQCECGKKSVKLLTEVKNRTQSCRKCQNRGDGGKKPYGEASFNSLYAGYRNNARLGGSGKPNKEFSISKDEAKKLFEGKCFYCGNPPSQIYKSKGCNGEFIYNGIDRKDNTKGYVIENCVSCCSFCNYTKNKTPFDEFLKWIRKVCENTNHIKFI